MIPGSVLHHILSGVRGPWLRPWTEILGFHFPLRFGGKPYYRAQFKLPRPSGRAWEFFPMLILWQVKGPLAPPLDRNFGFLQFFLWFRGKPYYHAKFQLPRPSGSAQTFCSTHRQTDRQTFSFIYI